MINVLVVRVECNNILNKGLHQQKKVIEKNELSQFVFARGVIGRRRDIVPYGIE